MSGLIFNNRSDDPHSTTREIAYKMGGLCGDLENAIAAVTGQISLKQAGEQRKANSSEISQSSGLHQP